MKKSILSVYILFDTEVDPNIIRTDDVILKFSGANLDFFSHAATESVSYFEVESFEDFCQTWKLIQTFLDIKLKKTD